MAQKSIKKDKENVDKIITDLSNSDFIVITKKEPKNKESLPILNLITNKIGYGHPIEYGHKIKIRK